MKQIFTLLFSMFFFSAFPQGITGAWNGALEMQGVKLHIVFNIVETAAGYKATMDSPDQGVKDIPMEWMTFDKSVLTIALPMAQIKFSGSLEQSDAITGTFSQGPGSWPLILRRGSIDMKRPQEPKGPFTYYAEDVTFPNTVENFNLAGTLTLPKKDGKFPVVVLISGSGQQDRNSTVMGHKPFLVLADHLTKLGIGVLRFDDRGFGESKGNPMKSTSADFAVDVQSAINYLKTRNDIDAKKIGLVGHSEGGIIAPMVAAGSNDIAFVVLLAGTGIPGDELLMQQSYELAKVAGSPDADIQAMQKANREIYNLIKAETDDTMLQTKMSALLKAQMMSMPEEQRPAATQMDAAIQRQVETTTIPWMTFFIRHDPSTSLKKVKVPVLIMNGEKDLQVPAKSNVAAIQQTLKNAGNKNVEAVVLPNLNHLFQESTTGAVDEYAKIEQTFSPAALQVLSSWILKQVK